MKNNAIFIHSLFRSSSTYLFNVFRESSDLYYCYQEPDSEQLVSIDTNPNKLLTFDNKLTSHLRHPSLEKSYFEEIYQLKEHLTNLYSVAFSFEDFFPIGEHLPENQKNYFGTLIEKAPKRAVLQLCRSFGRIAQFKKTFGGTHIHLWREPRSQWWSYLIDPYFEYTNELILNARNLPDVFDKITKKTTDIDYYSVEQRYYRFFYIWVYSYIENLKYSNFEINIDLVCSSAIYKERLLKDLNHAGITNINFKEAKSQFIHFSQDEIKAYDKIERSVFEHFESLDYQQDKINLIKKNLTNFRSNFEQNSPKSDVQDKYRDVARRFISENNQSLANFIQTKTNLEAQLAHLTQHLAELESINQETTIFNIQEISQRDHLIQTFEAQVLQLNTNLASAQAKLEQNSIDFDTQLLAATAQQKQLETTFNNTLKTKNEALENANNQIEIINYKLKIDNEALENANEQVRTLSGLIDLNETNLADAGKQIEALTQKLSLAEQQITTIHNSTSWKLSKPIRFIGHLAKSPVRSTKNIVYRIPNSHLWLKNATKKTLKKAGKAALKYPWLKNKALGFLYSRPALKAKLRFLILTQETTLFTQTVQAEAITEITAEKDLSTAVVRVKKHNPDAINAENKTPLEAYFY